jgi:type IX secretion system substrate protein
MKKTVVFAIYYLLIFNGNAQSYPAAAGQAGSTAIHKNDASFVAWVTGIQVTRGFKKISDPSLGYTTSGLPEYAVGSPNGDIVSLGDRGEAIVTFNLPITNGPGFDFAVFENGSTGYLELAVVKVSSDGVNYFDFPTHSQTQTDTQIGTFGSPQATYLNNIAGKYDGAYGTPFDLSEIPNNVLLDKGKITHVKITDVVGSIDSQYATYDSYGNTINDSFPTPFDSGGFDLQAVGVIHQNTLSTDNFAMESFILYPNPAKDIVFLDINKEIVIVIYDLFGRVVKSLPKGNYKQINVSDLNSGNYFLQVSSDEAKEIKKIIIQ